MKQPKPIADLDAISCIAHVDDPRDRGQLGGHQTSSDVSMSGGVGSRTICPAARATRAPS